MSKVAANMAARSLAIDLEPRGIAVGLIHPGSVKISLNKLDGEAMAELTSEMRQDARDTFCDTKSGIMNAISNARSASQAKSALAFVARRSR